MDIYLCALVGVLGCVLVKLECEAAPLILGYVLGPLMEGISAARVEQRTPLAMTRYPAFVGWTSRSLAPCADEQQAVPSLERAVHVGHAHVGPEVVYRLGGDRVYDAVESVDDFGPSRDAGRKGPRQIV